MALGGCNVTPQREPFDPQPPVEVEGLPRAAAGVLGHAGMAVSDALLRLGGGTPDYLRWARTLNDPDATPDEIRQALMGLVRFDFGRRAPYTDAYTQFARMAQADLVRATAVRALNISRDRSSIPLLIEKLTDEAAVVRMEAAKALGNLPSEEAITPLMAVAQNAQEDLDVRIAAIDALRHYDNPQLKQSLARLLGADEFSLAWQARRSLVTITGEDHGFDIDAWRRALG